MPIKLERNKADKVHLGHRLGIFLHTILQCLWSQVVFFKERDIPSRKRGLTLCLPFERLQCLFEKSAVMVWKNQNKLIRIQFHRNMAPSTNRFQHHSKLRSIYIYIYLYLLMYLYIYHCVFCDHAVLWTECWQLSGICSFKKVHHLFEKGARFPPTVKHHSKFQHRVLLCRLWSFYQKNMVFLDECVENCVCFLTMNSLREIQYFLKTMERNARMFFTHAALFLK